MRTCALFGSDSEIPVFVVGMVRSGTSLVEQILASHPHGFGVGELKDIDQIANVLPGRLNSGDGYPMCVSRIDPAMRQDAGLSLSDAPGPARRRGCCASSTRCRTTTSISA